MSGCLSTVALISITYELSKPSRPVKVGMPPWQQMYNRHTHISVSSTTTSTSFAFLCHLLNNHISRLFLRCFHVLAFRDDITVNFHRHKMTSSEDKLVLRNIIKSSHIRSSICIQFLVTVSMTFGSRHVTQLNIFTLRASSFVSHVLMLSFIFLIFCGWFLKYNTHILCIYYSCRFQ